MEYRFRPRGVCSQEMVIELDGDIIKSVKIIGGCAGNTARSIKVNPRNENR